MTKAQRQRDRKYKIWLFLAAYSAFVIIRFIRELAQFSTFNTPSGPTWPLNLSNILTVVLWCVCFVISITISRRKIFQSKYVKFLFAGFYAWILWGAFTNFAGLSFAGGWRGYRECIIVTIFTHTLYMAVKIIKIYDIKRQVIGITVLVLGLVILYAFIAYFNGFAFMNSISNLFQKHGRYRYAYGFKHVNTAGFLTIMFIIYTITYRTISQEDKAMHKIGSIKGGIFIVLLPAALLILVSTASRTSISCLILFWLVYFVINHYSGTKMYIRAMLITLSLFFIFLVIHIIDWQGLFDYFWDSRGVNYTKALPFLTDRKLWLVGIGLLKKAEVKVFTDTGVLDSYYLAVLLQTGIIGCIIFFGTVFIFIFFYFRNIRCMTKLHKLTGGIIALILFYAVFEGAFFGHGPMDLLNWILIISCMNEKASMGK